MLRFGVLSGVLALTLSGVAQGQSGIDCQDQHGRRLHVPGASSCPYGLSPATAPRPQAIPPQLAAFLAKGPVEIKAVQEALIALGHLEGEADGAYGPQTGAAIQKWLKQKGLSDARTYLIEQEGETLKAEAAAKRAPPPDTEKPTDTAGKGQAFRCPARGTVFTYGTMTNPPTVIGERIALGRDGFSCFYLVRADGGARFGDTLYFAGFWRALVPEEQDYVGQLEPNRLWPIDVGKSIEGKVTVDKVTTSVRISVERTETLELPIGSTNTYVVTVREVVSNDGRESVIESTFWWAIELGEIVRFAAVENGKETASWQVVYIAR